MVKKPPANAGEAGSIPGSGRSPGGGHGNPLQCSRLENPMDGGARWATVHGVAKRQCFVPGLTAEGLSWSETRTRGSRLPQRPPTLSGSNSCHLQPRQGGLLMSRAPASPVSNSADPSPRPLGAKVCPGSPCPFIVWGQQHTMTTFMPLGSLKV